MTPTAISGWGAIESSHAGFRLRAQCGGLRPSRGLPDPRSESFRPPAEPRQGRPRGGFQSHRYLRGRTEPIGELEALPGSACSRPLMDVGTRR